MPGLHFDVTADNTSFIRRMRETQDAVTSTVRNVEANGQSLNSIFDSMNVKLNKIGIAAATAFSADKTREFLQSCIDVRAEIQAMEISFTTLLGGNESKASQMINEIRAFASSTPMDMSTLAKGARTMLGFNIEAEKIMPMLHALGDISMGDAQKFESLSLAFSQMSATGKLMGQDLLQMINAGFNPLAEISAKTGESIADLKKKMEAGGISTEMVTNAFLSATSEGGKFNNMLKQQAEGLNGSFAYLRGAVTDMKNDIGASLSDITVSGVNMAATMVKNYKEIGEAIAALIATYGVYKVAVMATAAIDSANAAGAIATVQQAYNAEAATLASLIPAKEAEARSALEEAVASGSLTTAKAAEIAMLREEAAAYIESLSAQEAAALAKAKAAQADVDAADAMIKTAADAKEAIEQQADVLFDLGDTIGFEAAQREIQALNSEIATLETDRNTASEAVNTATTEANALARERNAATTQLNAASTAADTAATATNSAATNILTLAKIKLAAMTARLHAIVMANPYALAAAAVAALAYGIYKLVTHQTEAEKAQAQLNETVAKSKAEVDGERQSIENMFSVLRETKDGTEEYEQAKQAIIDQYGQYLHGLIDEKGALLDVEAAYIRVKEAAIDAANARGLESATKTARDTYEESVSGKRGEIYDLLKKKTGNKDKLQAIMNLIDKDLSGSGYLSSATEKAIYADLGIGKKDRNDADIVHQIRRKAESIRSARKIYDASMDEARAQFEKKENPYKDMDAKQLKTHEEAIQRAIDDARTFGEVSDIVVYANGQQVSSFKSLSEAQLALGQISERQTAIDKEATIAQKKNLQTRYDAAKKTYDDSVALVNKMEADRSKYTDDEYKAAVQNRDTAKKSYEALGGKTSTTGKTAGQKGSESEKAHLDYLDLMKQQGRERERTAEDMAAKEEQAAINALAEGAEKTRRQRILNHRQEMTQLQRDKEDEIQAEIDRQREVFNAIENEKAARQKNYAKLNFNADNIDNEPIVAISQQYDAIMAETKKKQERENNEAVAAELQLMNEYLLEYGTFQQKKLAITQEYAAKIASTQDQWAIKSLERERDQKLSANETDAIKQRIDWAEVFSGFGTMFTGMMKDTLDDINKYIESSEFKALQPADQKAIVDGRDSLQTKIGGKGTLDFGKLGKQVTEYQAKLQKLNDVQEMHKADVEALSQATAKYKEALKNGTEEQQVVTKSAVDIAATQAEASAKAVKAAQTAAEDAGKVAAKTARDLNATMDTVTEGLSKLASGSLRGAYDGIISMGQKLGGVMSKVADSLESVPIVGWILSILDILQDGLSNLVGGLLDGIFNAVGGIIGDIFSGSLFKTIAQSVIKGLGSILNGLSFGGWNKLMDSITGSNSKEVAKTTERLTKRNELLSQSIDALTAEMGRARGMQSVKAAEQAKEKQEEYTRNVGDILAAQMSKHGKHKSNNHYINKALTDDDWKEIRKVTGSNISAAKDLWTLSPEQLRQLQEIPEIWDKIVNSGKYDKNDYLNNYLDQVGKVEEITEALKETLTSISFDSMYDSFISSLMDMDNSAKDIADDLSEYFMKAMLSNKIGDIYSDRLRAWYDKYAEAMADDGTLSDAEIAELKKEYSDIVAEAVKDRDNIAAATGYKDTYSQEASRGSWESLGEDTGQELNGRFTALQISNQSIADQMAATLSAIIALSSSAVETNATLSAILVQQVLTNSHLEDVVANTSQLQSIKKLLDNISQKLNTI